MIYEQETIRTLYRKLLTLYPRGFRDQLGESMQQSFDDLCNERRHDKNQSYLSFVLWMFSETVMGIIREHILLVAQGDLMQTILTHLRSSALISFLLVLPFMILEVVNRRNFNTNFPIPLFLFMWLLPVLFILTGMPIIRNVRVGNSILANPILLFIRVVFMGFLAWLWFSVLIDQMPCFLGVPNCD